MAEDGEVGGCRRTGVRLLERLGLDVVRGGFEANGGYYILDGVLEF